jgi:hypothetical protein
MIPQSMACSFVQEIRPVTRTSSNSELWLVSHDFFISSMIVMALPLSLLKKEIAHVNNHIYNYIVILRTTTFKWFDVHGHYML